MKTFFDSVFIDSQKLRKEEIFYPIKLEYYKIENKDKNVEAKYGIEIIKTEYREDTVKIESNKLENLTRNSNEADKILKLLKNNEVTPVSLNDVIEDLEVKV